MPKMRSLVLAASAALACAAGAFELDPLGCGNRKIILTGWEFSTLAPADYLANAEAFDKTPADGVVIYIQRNPAVGRNFEATDIMTGPLWTDEKLADLVEPMVRMTRQEIVRLLKLRWRNTAKAWMRSGRRMSRRSRRRSQRQKRRQATSFWRNTRQLP